MYVNIKDILNDAAERHYGVIATATPTMELARAAVTAAHRNKAPLIIILGGIMMARHANPELLVPVIRKLADEAAVPVALCLDHGRDFNKAAYCVRNGFSSVMIDGSAYDMQTNIRMTRQVVELCHPLNMAVEGELGHVGVAAKGDGRDTSLYTDPGDAARFKAETDVDCLAVAVGTAHGKYPEGFVPKIDFDLIRRIKDATGGMPIALHGGSGAGDENIIKAVEAGINKINVATDVLASSRQAAWALLSRDPGCDYILLMEALERGAFDEISHWIGLSGSIGKAEGFPYPNSYERLLSSDEIYDRWAE